MTISNGAEATQSSELDVTCEFGEYPYCPLCQYGCEIQEEWMLEDQCEWHCYHPNNKRPGNIKQR